MNQENRLPEFEKKAFDCPNCSVYASQQWSDIHNNRGFNLNAAYCLHCLKSSLWLNGQLMYPKPTKTRPPHKDMPESVLEYYNEAQEVSVYSTRAAAALLRTAAKKLCEELGEEESNLNRAISNLSEKGLPQDIIRSLHIVRIVGNEGGAHEGQIDLSDEDNIEMVDRLFWLVNIIVEKTIGEQKEINRIFGSLPENKRTAIEKRDERK